MYKYNFTINFKDVPESVGRYHIHCPEHVAKIHKLGVPGFKITKVSIPVADPKGEMASINFDCNTIGKDLRVNMFSKNRNESVLLFNSLNNTESPLWVLGVSRDPFLCLKFNVEGFDEGQSHRLIVSFQFWNRFLLLIVPLFPLFVMINRLEDEVFLRTMADKADNHFNDSQWSMFSLYRLYIYLLYLESQVGKN